MSALGIADIAHDLVPAEQVHGRAVSTVGTEDRGRGSRATAGPPPVAATDALVTDVPRLPLMLFFADCVPVVLADPLGRRIAVVHAGWRGAYARISRAAVECLSAQGSRPTDLLAYIGPHICGEHYAVSNELFTDFAQQFATVSKAEAGHLDLGAVVSEDLQSSVVRVQNICRLGICTVEATDRFYSYRASGTTGRHAAIAAILR
jgi:hypothetical protein